MQDKTANLVHPVLAYGLRLKERLGRGDRADLNTEQTNLKGLLGGQGQAGAVVEWSSDGAKGFLGIRYALACWLDEIFILDSPWGKDWQDNSLEWALFTSNDRAWKFWDQAELAKERPGSDAIETYFLCVMLGFRGNATTTKLQAFRGAVEGRVAEMKPWQEPPGPLPPTNVDPLRGRERLRRMILLGLLLLGLLIPVVTFFLVLLPKT